MSRSGLFRWAFTIALTTMLVSPLLAQEHDQSGPAVEGTVSDVTGSIVKLLNGLITVDASAATVVGEHDNQPLTLADVKVGTVVQVSGGSGTAVQILATVIRVHGPKFDGKIQGPIDSVDLTNGRFSILGQTILLTATTVFEGDNGTSLGPSDLVPGKSFDVEVAVFQNSLIATRISPDQGEAQSESGGGGQSDSGGQTQSDSGGEN